MEQLSRNEHAHPRLIIYHMSDEKSMINYIIFDAASMHEARIKTAYISLYHFFALALLYVLKQN